MKPRLVAFLVIASILAAAVTASFTAKTAGATSIVCNPLIPRDIKAERFKGVQHT